MQGRWLFGTLVWFVGLSSGCGGAEKPAESAAERGSESRVEAESSADEGSEASGEEEASAPSTPAATCSDGTCAVCGDALCPSGWYCDESAKGGPACGWLPECAKKPTCACVKRAFSGCTCEEQGGTARVTCG